LIHPVGCHLSVPQVLKYLALLLSLAKFGKLANSQSFEFGDALVYHCHSSETTTVTGDFELEFCPGYSLSEILCKPFRGRSPFLLQVFRFLARLNHLAGDDLKSKAFAMLEAFAEAEDGLEREAKGHGND
jgi:hypothetical protein